MHIHVHCHDRRLFYQHTELAMHKMLILECGEDWLLSAWVIPMRKMVSEASKTERDNVYNLRRHFHHPFADKDPFMHLTILAALAQNMHTLKKEQVVHALWDTSMPACSKSQSNFSDQGQDWPGRMSWQWWQTGHPVQVLQESWTPHVNHSITECLLLYAAASASSQAQMFAQKSNTAQPVFCMLKYDWWWHFQTLFVTIQ